MPATPAAPEASRASDRGTPVRRAGALVGNWDDEGFTLENPLSGRRTSVSPAIAPLLQEAGSFIRPPELADRFAHVPDVRALIERLVERDVLLEEGSELELKDRLLERAWEWGHDARFFHYGSQHVAFAHDAPRQHAELVAHARDVPAPSPYKSCGPGTPLPHGSFEEDCGEFWDTLRRRRTHRVFAAAPLPLEHFARVLLWTWGRTEERVDAELGPYILKTSPSGGSRHPIEVYPLVLRVDGVAPGVYHYSVEQHALEELRLGSFADLALELCGGQPWIRAVPAIFFMTAVVERSMWKYRDSHAYRVLLLDAGHLGQTFHLVCTRLGLAPFTTAATDDRAIERALGLDGVTEIALYTAAAGVPA